MLHCQQQGIFTEGLRLQSHTFSLGAPDISLKAGRKLRVTDSDPQALEGRLLKITYSTSSLSWKQNSTEFYQGNVYGWGLFFTDVIKFQASVKAEKAKTKLLYTTSFSDNSHLRTSQVSPSRPHIYHHPY